MSRRVAFAASASFALLLTALIAAVLYIDTDTGPDGDSATLTALPGWTLRSGAADALVQTDGALHAAGDVSIERNGVTLEITGGSKLSGAPNDGAIPDVTSGRLVVAAVDAIIVGGLEIDPSGPARFAVTPELLEVIQGSIAVGGRVLGPGGVLFRHAGEGESVAVEPAPARAGGAGEIAVRAPRATGRVIDARDGRPLVGVRVRATYSESADGYPPHPGDGETDSVSTVTSGAGGRFFVPRYRVSDPTLELHLEVDHDGYLPSVRVIEAEPELDGTRPFVTFRLRPAETTRVFVLTPDGAPLAGAAVRVTRRDDFDRFVGEDLWDDGEARRANVTPVRYTDESGAIRIGTTPHDFVLLHPLLHMWRLELQDIAFVESFPPAAPRQFWRTPFIIRTAEYTARDYEVLDLERRAADRTLVEIELEGMPAIRTYTEHEGRFAFAPWPRPRDHPRPLSYRHPRAGSLTTRSPLLWKRGANVEMPAPHKEIIVNGRTAPLLSLRCVTAGESPDEPVPLVPHGVRLASFGAEARSIGATLIHRDAAGRVIFAGELPAGGSRLTAFVRGFLPARIDVPAWPRGKPIEELDLGDVLFKRGETTTIRIAEATLEESRRRGLRPVVLLRDRGADDPVEDGLGSTRDLEFPPHDQTYPLDAREIRVGGLLRGRWYDIAAEGAELSRHRIGLQATEDRLEEGVDLVLPWQERVATRVTALADSIPEDERSSYRVVERFFDESGGAPRIFSSYPLPPDGRAGSTRLIPPSKTVELFIVGTGGFEGGSARRRDFDGDTHYDLGRIQVSELRSASFQFRVDGVGAVAPPRTLTLESTLENNHEVALVDTVRDHVLVRNLLPGTYVLRWGDGDEPRGAHKFTVEAKDFRIRDIVKRRPLAEERVLVRIENAKAQPLGDVRVWRLLSNDTEGDAGRGRGTDSRRRELLENTRPRQLPDAADRFREKRAPILSAFTEPGYYWIPLRRRATNRLRFESESGAYLPATAEFSYGAEVDRPIVLRTSTRVSGRVIDIDGRAAQGRVRVRWQPPEPAAATGERDARRARTGSTVRTRVRPGQTPPEQPLARATFGITHGEPLALPLSANGDFVAKGFPPGRNDFVFTLEHTDAKAAVQLELDPDRVNRIGVIEMRETRSIRGRVFLADGSPAPGAIVALSKSTSAYRLPQRELRLDQKLYSARTDELGRFTIDGLPLDLGQIHAQLGEEIALVAHLDGWSDAVEDPVDFEREEHPLVLRYETELVVDASYTDGVEHPDFAFRLDFRFLPLAGDGSDALIDLGEVPALTRGESPFIFRGMTPGLYRLSWDLLEPHPNSVPRVAELIIEPETAGRLSLRIRDTFCRATATLNGNPLADGWALITDDPGDPIATRLGRVIDGVAELPVASKDRAWVALIPRLTPVPAPNFLRGEVLPIEYDGYRFDVRKRRLDIDYRAFTLTYELPEADLRRYSGIEVEFPHYVWEQRRFRVERRAVPIQGSGIRLFLLPPGPIGLRFKSPGGYRHYELVDLRSHRDIRFRPTRE